MRVMLSSLVAAASVLVAVVSAAGCGGSSAASAAPPAPTAPGRLRYVAPTGSDANPGTAEAPWGTPGHASRQLEPGDTLIVRGGRYVLSRYDEDIIKPPSGTADAWVTIRGEAGERPVLAGRDDLLTAIDLSGVSYVQIEHLEITHDAQARGPELRFRDAFEIVDAEASHIVLQDLYIHHIDEGAVNIQDVEDLQVLDCRFEYCGFGALMGPAGLHGGWRNVVIRGCELSYGGHYYQGGDGSDRPYDRPDGFGIEPGEGPIEIVDCVAQHNYGDGLDSKAANTTIRNCIVANNSCDGIKLWGDNSKVESCLVYGIGDGVGGASPWAGIVIGTERAGARFEMVNVTVHDNPTRQAYPMYVQYDSAAPISLVLRNCIVANGYGLVYIGDSVDLTADHSLLYRPSEEAQVYANGREYTAGELGALGPGNLSADPLFVQPAWGTEGDYHLQAGSPALDQGTAPGAPATDLAGTARPQGAGYDIGAYEQ